MLHRRAYELLLPTAAAPELAHHALHAGLFAAAFRHSLLAGDDAMRLFAVRDAISHYRTAQHVGLRLAETIATTADWQQLCLQLGRAYELIDHWEEAAATYEAFLHRADSAKAPTLAYLALNRLATVYTHGLIDLPRATDYLQQALLIAIEYDDKASLVETQWSLALVARLGAQSHLALHHAKETLATARQVGQPELVARSLNTLLYPNMRLRHWQATIACAEEALRYYEARGEQIMQAECLRLQAGPGADRTRWTWRLPCALLNGALPWRKR